MRRRSHQQFSGAFRSLFAKSKVQMADDIHHARFPPFDYQDPW
jgi:hypothetical protein